MSKNILVWKLYIKMPDEDEPVIEIIDINDYTEAVVNDLHGYYNWLCDEYRWYVMDVELLELPKREVSIPRWADFTERYGDGSCLGIRNLDWENALVELEKEIKSQNAKWGIQKQDCLLTEIENMMEE